MVPSNVDSSFSIIPAHFDDWGVTAIRSGWEAGWLRTDRKEIASINAWPTDGTIVSRYEMQSAEHTRFVDR